MKQEKDGRTNEYTSDDNLWAFLCAVVPLSLCQELNQSDSNTESLKLSRNQRLVNLPMEDASNERSFCAWQV